MTVRRAGEVPAEAVSGGTAASRQVLIGADLSGHFAIRRFAMEPGGGMPLHTNAVEHGQYVLAGRAAVRIGDDEVEVEPGDCLHIPAGVPHSYRVCGSERFEFICVVPSGPDEVKVMEEGS